MTDEQVRIAVVVPVFNKLAHLPAAMRSILNAAAHAGSCDVVAIDHGSTDGSRAHLAALPALTCLDVVGGTIGELRNLGATVAEGDIISFLDCDVVIPPDYFSRLRHHFADHANAGIGCEVGLPPQPHWIEAVWHHLVARTGSGRRHYINSANFAVRRNVFMSVGGFAPGLLTGEDTDLCRRLINAGYSVWQYADLEVAHLDNPRSLTAFFRKERWRGLGARSAARHVGLDKVLVMTSTWMVTVTTGVAAMVWGASQGDIRAVVLGAVSATAIAALTIAYRCMSNRRIVPIVPAMVLVSCFYAARLSALLSPSTPRKALQPLTVIDQRVT